MEDVLENKKYVYKYGRENSYINIQRDETLKSNKSDNMDETEKDINEMNSIYIENLQDENNNIHFYNNNIEVIKQANEEINQSYKKCNPINNKAVFMNQPNININGKGTHLSELDNKFILQKQKTQYNNGNINKAYDTNITKDKFLNGKSEKNREQINNHSLYNNNKMIIDENNFEKNYELLNLGIKQNDIIYSSDNTIEENNLYSPYYNVEPKGRRHNSIGIYQLNYINNANCLNSANSTNCTSNNNNVNSKTELISKTSLINLKGKNKNTHIYNNNMDIQNGNNFYDQNQFNIFNEENNNIINGLNNNRKGAWLEKSQNEKNAPNYIYYNQQAYDDHINNSCNEFSDHSHLYNNKEDNKLYNYYQNEGKYYEPNSGRLVKDYSLKIINKKIRNVSPLHHRAYSNISHKGEPKNKIISNLERERLFSDQNGNKTKSQTKLQYNSSPYKKRIKGNNNVSPLEIKQKKHIKELNKFLTMVNYYENDKKGIIDTEGVSANLGLVGTASPNLNTNTTKANEHNYTDKLNNWNNNNKISYHEMGRLKNYTKCKMIDSYEKTELESFEKRGSFSYSGILTSMISSILTQQNDRKLEHNNCLYNGFRNTNNVDNYEYNLLYNIKDGEDIKNKYIFSKKATNKINLQNQHNNVLILTLTLMIGLSVLCNFDHGAIPVTLEEIQKDFPLSYIEQSLLGSLVYCGLIFGTIIASILFELISAKLLVTVSIILLSISLYIFSNASGMMIMYISRFVNGLCQAIPVVYLPVWVDEFSPDEKATQWMSYIQLASIGGTVFGYFLGGILSNNYNQANTVFNNMSFVTTWRSPFLIQAFLLLPIFLIMIFIPSNMINISSEYSDIEKDEIEDFKTGENEFGSSNIGNLGMDEYNEMTLNSQSNIFNSLNKKNKHISPYQGQQTNMNRKSYNRSATYIMEQKTNVLKKTFKEVKKLLNNKLYIIITLGMSNLYFVVTGIQFWITEYMSVVLLTEKMKIVTVSTLCFLTSPTSGVWFGGFICDLFGGYKNTNYSKTIKVATAFAISACIFGILSAHLTNFIFFSISLWLCLFTGSALVPVAVGMLLSCVSNHQKSLSSAVSQVIYNVFGWFSAPLLSGIIMDIMHKYTNNNRLALKAGFTMILYSSCIGFFLLLYANFLDFSDKKGNEETHELEEPLM
ncbi:major facilitator superfamily domain-containing protein, putative [Plasmodium chabaudi chabaudi]|uniref:Major facilitator superfamily domain-containing protein, putative n=1 Tax=Plasmodium chabaudi chabaudi TaxID=31271 RepID=A0A4V0K5V4_PLACU|nr:major facilitator superfamily domain-containing protein, putative [Plasmodium chabaudi chabaudi]VTZ68381.1 major facilitator superfamily domain-containing protein, putative [Plasmodium chabaudi chabaudi]|eukprot:XP_743052.2 sugar transporter, putative [Plasmodium chabaudi chabaudi]